VATKKGTKKRRGLAMLDPRKRSLGGKGGQKKEQVIPLCIGEDDLDPRGLKAFFERGRKGGLEMVRKKRVGKKGSTFFGDEKFDLPLLS